MTNASSSSAAINAVGRPITDLPIQTTRGDGRLSDFRGHALVIYFYPKDDTSGCTLEGQDFTALHSEFLKAGTQVIGISRDTLSSHERFVKKYGFSITLVADTSEALCHSFGVIKMKNMYGKQVQGIERSTFLIDSTGVLRKEWRGVKVPNHAQEVLAEAKKLS